MSTNVPSIGSDDDSVIISIPKERFGDFLYDLVSSKRSLSRQFDHIFNINKSHIDSIFHIIDHRIKEQNTAQLVSFDITVRYQDGSRRRYETLEMFMSMNDKFQSASENIIMNLSYLVKFNENNVPMKQDIAILVATNTPKPSISGRFKREILGIFPIKYSGAIDIEIKSNSFTWADDIISHVKNYLDGLFDSPGIFRKCIEWLKDGFPILMFPLFLLYAAGMEMMPYSGDYGLDRAAILRDALLEGSNIDEIANKIDALIRYELLAVPPNLKMFRMPLGVISLFALSAMMIFSSALIRGKYLSLNDYSARISERNESRKKHILIVLVVAFVVSVTASVFANWLWLKII